MIPLNALVYFKGPSTYIQDMEYTQDIIYKSPLKEKKNSESLHFLKTYQSPLNYTKASIDSVFLHW